MSAIDEKIEYSSTFSKALNMYVNCTERNGKLIESRLSKAPKSNVLNRGASKKLADYLDGIKEDLSDVEYVLEGTDFQVAVWKELYKIPKGATVTYGEIAKRISRPRSSRAVGNAVGSNKLTILVPCHRVVAAGGLGGYSAEGGIETKKKILKIENAL